MTMAFTKQREGAAGGAKIKKNGSKNKAYLETM